MSNKISPIIDSEELLKLKDSSEIILIDARAGVNAEENYQKEHLLHARFVDLNRDLAHVEDDPAKGGRHPLPSLAQFTMVLSKIGISPLSHIIIYDDKNGSNAAARFWWMLRAIGHEKVQVVNGGLQAAIQAGYPISSAATIFKTTTYNPLSGWILALAEIEEVEKARNSAEHLIIDVRDANRFEGLTEPLDLVAGHILGAKNIPFSENLNEKGFFKSATVLHEKYAKIIADKNPEHVIVHCGSGVTACHTLLAMDYAGIPIPKLYVGSWSEWSRQNRVMATKETK
jgi:3-mercaptopyruvate sulfurtransferase SseA